MADFILFDQVSFAYNEGTPFEVPALQDLSFAIPQGEVTAIIGHTGSGKSTLLQHMNALLRPTKGRVVIGDVEVTADSEHNSLKALRKQVGIVFQFPESQLFEETVIKDVMFGPLNYGLSEAEARRIASEKLTLVGIPEALFERSPFDLSGGQMRRVAIAGVLALEPECLILDEPTAGLDPAGRDAMMELFISLQEKYQLTLILVTHQMDDVARYAQHVLVMEAGRLARQGSVREIFQDQTWLIDKQLNLPKSIDFMQRLTQQIDTRPDLPEALAYPLTVEELVSGLITWHQALSSQGGRHE